jgi:hypothetical protein
VLKQSDSFYASRVSKNPPDASGGEINLGLGLPPEVAIGSGLIVEVFGFGSGVYAYAKRQLIDYRVGGMLLSATVPAAIAGVVVAHYVSADILKVVLGMGLFAVAISFLRAPDAETEAHLDDLAHESTDTAETCLVTAKDEEICIRCATPSKGASSPASAACSSGWCRRASAN